MPTPFRPIRREAGRIEAVTSLELTTRVLPDHYGRKQITACVEFVIVGHTDEMFDYMRLTVFKEFNPNFKF